MSNLTAQQLFGKDVEVQVGDNGEELYFKRLQVGGKDDKGIYEIMLDDGPAAGEKYYHD